VVVSLDALEWVARPALLLDAMQRYRAAFVWLPNFAFHHILRAVRDTDRWDLTSVKAIVNCAEPCRAATFDRFAERFTGMGIDQAKLRVCYAMAENVFAVTQTPPGAMVRRGETNDTRAFLSCGRPIDGVTVEIRMEDGSLAQSGAVGEIRVRSSTLFEGYFRQPGLSAERLRDDWFHTKDLGCMEAGELFVLGRVDDLLIVNGKNLFAHEIENLVSGLAGMAPGRTLACTEFDPRLGAMRLLVLGEPEAGVEDVATLESAIRQLVLSHTGIFPGTVRLLPRGYLLKSSSGKLARAASIRKYQGLLAYQSA
jgi:acyl-CoA synthetase (AMP-forming)/AMP-acid ligase II